MEQFLHTNINRDLIDKTKRIRITYTDFGSFYGAYLHTEPEYSIDNHWFEKLRSIRDVNDFLANHDVVNRISNQWNPSNLNKVVTELKSKGINADFDDCMDVS
tara:strand:- start:15838 stop:16146 length:309 start_codon:yes stop_codon:yes gene_type:complete